MNRRTIALAGAATAVLAGAAAMATAAGDAPRTIDACRNLRHGLVRIVFDANACKRNEAHLAWSAQGPVPALPALPARRARRATPGAAGPCRPGRPEG